MCIRDSSAASVPKVTVVMRKAYGGAYLAMCSKDLGADYVFAWPTAEIAVMGAEGAVNVVFRKEIAAAGDEEEQARVRDERIADYKTRFSTPYVAASRGLVDDVIDPAETRLLSLIHISEPTRREWLSRMPSSA